MKIFLYFLQWNSTLFKFLIGYIVHHWKGTTAFHVGDVKLYL